MSMRILYAGIIFVAAGLIVNCSTGGSSSSSSSADPVALLSAISTSMKVGGTAMQNGIAATHPQLEAAGCNNHGYPGATGTNNQLATSDPAFPGYLTYCFTTVDTGDTILGGFDTPAFVACMIKNSGIAYDNLAHQITITNDIISACSINTGQTGLTAGTVINVTTSTPAAFNSNYTYGAVMVLPQSFGLTFSLGTNVSGTKSSFITHEVWSSGEIGATAGTIDTSTGDLWYESRLERSNCGTSGSCGWNRHTRVHEVLTMSGGSATGLASISFAYSNIQFLPGQGGLGGLLVTAQGDLTNGIKARLWQATDGTGTNPPAASTDYDVAANWSEVTNSNCYTSSSDTAACASQTGLVDFSTNTKFLLDGPYNFTVSSTTYTRSADDGHTGVATWFGAITGQTFTNVNVDADTQY